MKTISAYLQDAVIQRENLVNNLTAKGVPASVDEKFNTLVEKVNDIPTGGGGGTTLYNHFIEATIPFGGKKAFVKTAIVTSLSTPFTAETFGHYLYDGGAYHKLMATGHFFYANALQIIDSVWGTSSALHFASVDSVGTSHFQGAPFAEVTLYDSIKEV